MTDEERLKMDRVVHKTKQQAMAARCLEQGHEWENYCSLFLRAGQRCKWCGLEVEY